MSGATLRIERHGVVRWLVLDRPTAANALNTALHDALVAALADTGAGATIIAGAGTRSFCAGADLKELADRPPAEAKARRRGLLLRTLLAVLDHPRPVVAAITGKAVGGGAMLALLADEVVMADTAAFLLPEIGLRLPSPVGAAIIAARGGRNAAHRLIQTGAPMAAEEAARAGLADFVCSAEALAERATERAEALAALDADAYAVNKAWIAAPLRAAILAAERAAAAAAGDDAA